VEAMENLYFATLKKDHVINGREIKARQPLIIKLYESETPEKHTLNLLHDISLAAIGRPLIGSIPLKEIEGFVVWGKKK
jgi:hypothetical protein